MTRLEGERIAREAALLLREDPPPEQLTDPERLADLLCHHDLGPLASHLVGHHIGWGRKLAGSPLDRLDSLVLPAKIRRHMVVIALADALTVLYAFHPLLFKGLVLADLYPEAHLRDPGDLDILVQPREFDAAADALAAAGWRLQPSMHRDRPDDVAEEYSFALVFRHPVRPVILDLHRAPVDRTEPFWIDPEAIFARTERIRFSEGIGVSTPAPEIHLALIALHSVRHGTFRLRWFYDLHLACLAWREQLDQERFEAFCREWKILRAVRVAFEIMAHLFNTPWHPLQHLVQDRRVERAAARRSPYVIARGHLTRSRSWRRVAALIDLLDSPGPILRYLLHTLFPPRKLYATREGGTPAWGRYLALRTRALLSAFSRKRPRRKS